MYRGVCACGKGAVDLGSVELALLDPSRAGGPGDLFYTCQHFIFPPSTREAAYPYILKTLEDFYLNMLNGGNTPK